MIGIVVAAHGGLAEALVSTAQMVVASSGRVSAVGISSQDDGDAYEQRLRAAIESVKGKKGVLIITDMFGGTPSNISLTLHKVGEVEVLTGANLPMVIKAMQMCSGEVELAEIAASVRGHGQRAIAVASEVLGKSDKAKT